MISVSLTTLCFVKLRHENKIYLENIIRTFAVTNNTISIDIDKLIRGRKIAHFVATACFTDIWIIVETLSPGSKGAKSHWTSKIHLVNKEFEIS